MKPLLKTCRVCGRDKTKLLLTTRSLPSQKVRGVYVDEDGVQWHGGVCGPCKGGLRRSYLPTRLTQDEINSKGRKAEWHVCRLIKQYWGIDVKPSSAWTGPDIVLPDGETVEVKCVNKKGEITDISPDRQRDTWLALVRWPVTVVIPMSSAFEPRQTWRRRPKVLRFFKDAA